MAEGLVIKNKLRIVRRVGRGGMGHVYEVYHEVLRVRRALKQIVSDLQDNPEIEGRFLHEAQMMARLEHPHIVKVFDVDQEPGFGTYLLMEFIQGRDLGTVVRERGRFSFEETARIGIAVASALDCAHAAGLVHRDIKPANILIEDGTGRPVVTDFGIAKEVEGAGDEGFTKTGSFIGTYRYSSREQIRAEKDVRIDGRADVYSLGVVLYEVSSGKRYLEGMPELKIASCVGYQEDWRPPLDFPEDLPESFRRLIERSLEPNRDHRVESARALMSALEECLGGATPIPLWSPSSPPPRGQAPPLAATATGSAGGGAALQELAEAPTALGDDSSDTGVTEQRARERARLVVRLQGLRKAVDGQSGEFEQLLKTLQDLDLPREEFRQLDDMSQILHRVEESEQEGELDAAIASLEGLSDRLQRNTARMEGNIAEAIERSRDELRQSWRRLAELGPEWLQRDRSESVERLLAGLAGALAGHRWDECRQTLGEGRAQIEGAWRNARESAGRRVESGLASLAERLSLLRSSAPEAAATNEVDPQALAGQLSALLERGELTRATEAVDAALAAVEQALGEVAARDAAALDAARERAAAAFAEIPGAGARRIAPDALAAAEAALAAATRSAETGDARRATESFEEACRLALDLAGRVAQTLAAERSAAEESVRELLASAQTADQALVGDPRRAAEAALARDRGDDAAAIAALSAARDALEAALLEAEEAALAHAEEERAAQALSRARALSPSAEELAPGEGRIAAGRAAAARREWRDAAERYAEATATLDALANEIAERRERDDLEVARQAAETLLESIPRESAASLAAAPLAAAESLLGSARAAASGGDRNAARSAFVGAAERLAVVRDAIAAHQVDATAALGRRWEEARPSLGDLVDAQVAMTIDELLGSARQATESLRLGEAERSLAEAAGRLADVREQAERRAQERLAGALEALATSAERMAQAAPAQSLADEHRADLLEPQARALLAEGRPAAAVAALETAAEAAARSVTEVLRRLEADCAEQRGVLRRLREELASRSLEAAEVAAAETAAAQEHESGAQAHEGGGRLEAALVEWRAAVRALEGATAAVDTAERARVEAECTSLEALLARSQDAAAEIAGEARKALADSIAAARRSGPGQAAGSLASLANARERLELALAEAVEQGSAVAARSEAEAAQKRVAALGAKRKQTKSGERALKDAAKSFDRKRWQEAASGYRQATDAFVQVEGELAQAAAPAAAGDDATRIAPAAESRKPPLAALAGAGLALVLVLAGWLWWRQAAPDSPTETPEPRRVTRVEPEPKKEPRVAPKESKPEPVAPAKQPGSDVAVAPEVVPQKEVAKVEPAPQPSAAIDVAKVEPPAPPAPKPVRIASFAPEAPAVRVPEGGRETFRIALADVPAGTSPEIEWRLGDEVVAKDVPEFTLTPGFDAAAKDGKPTSLVATVGGTEGPAQRWEVEIADVNRVPTLSATTPPTSRAIEAEIGTKIALGATVDDPDRDDLLYSWKIDGKPVAAKGPKLEVPVSGDARVELTASDGKESVRAEWQIAAIKPPFRLETRPANLTRLAFASPQEFRADVPRALTGDKIDVEWTVDGKRAATGSSFRFANDDPARIRKEPVRVGLRATDASGRSFTRDWSFVVTPPAPRLAGAEPRPGEVALARDGEQVFTVDAAEPIGGQALEYVFEVDGRRVASGREPRLAYRQRDDRSHSIVAYARDNFDQSSAKQRWTIKPSSPAADIVAQARTWLSQYRDAFNRKDAQKIGQLRGLSSDAVAKLSQALADQNGLQVDFSNVQVEKLDGNRARIRYDRTDRFTVARDGRAVERTGSVEQVVGVVGGRVQELETRRR